MCENISLLLCFLVFVASVWYFVWPKLHDGFIEWILRNPNASRNANKGEHDSNSGTMMFDEASHDPQSIKQKMTYAELYTFHLSLAEETIREVSVCLEPLKDYWPHMKIAYHAFTVIATDTGNFYSIEVSNENVSVQRSTKVEFVRDRYQQKWRKATLWRNLCRFHYAGQAEYVATAKGKGTMRDLFYKFYSSSVLTCPYHLILDNCQHLSKWIFDNFNDENRKYRLPFKLGHSDYIRLGRGAGSLLITDTKFYENIMAAFCPKCSEDENNLGIWSISVYMQEITTSERQSSAPHYDVTVILDTKAGRFSLQDSDIERFTEKSKVKPLVCRRPCDYEPLGSLDITANGRGTLLDVIRMFQAELGTLQFPHVVQYCFGYFNRDKKIWDMKKAWGSCAQVQPTTNGTQNYYPGPLWNDDGRMTTPANHETDCEFCNALRQTLRNNRHHQHRIRDVAN